MKTDYIDVNGYWGVVICHGLTADDEYDMRQSMAAFGMRDKNIDNAVDTLLCYPNTGMCVSRPDIRMSLVFIGNATGGDQWWDTTCHEVMYHAMCDICNYYDVPYGSEDGAWLTGYLMRQAVKVFGEPCY